MADVSSTKVLKPARNAVWKALRRWTLWSAKIQTFCDTDHAVQKFIQLEASSSRCPMLSVLWRTASPEWWVHTLQEWRVPLEISIWLWSDQQSLAEDLLEDAVDAVFRAETDDSLPAAPKMIVQEVCGKHPSLLLFEPAVPVDTDDNHSLLRSTVVIQLPLRKDPLKRAV